MKYFLDRTKIDDDYYFGAYSDYIGNNYFYEIILHDISIRSNEEVISLYIKCDDGKKRSFPIRYSKYFVPIDEFRDEKINKILS